MLFGAVGFTVVVCCLLGEFFERTCVYVEHEVVTSSVQYGFFGPVCCSYVSLPSFPPFLNGSASAFAVVETRLLSLRYAVLFGTQLLLVTASSLLWCKYVMELEMAVNMGSVHFMLPE